MALARLFVNCQDVPEASLVGGSGPLSRRLGYRGNRKNRVKSLPLPVLAEGGDDDALCSSVQLGSSWSCRKCTFFNSACEFCAMCEAPADDSAAVNDSAEMFSEDSAINSAMAVPMKDMDWPTIQEAVESFVDCDISSVASSWLEVGEGWEEEGDLVILKMPQQPATQSWAARAKVIAGAGPAATVAVAGFVGPPLQKACAIKGARTQEKETQGDEDWDLDCLEARRLRPHWSVQRLRGRTGTLARVRH